MKKKPSFRGFSLLELVVAMGLMAIMAGFTVLNMHSAGSGADSRSLATVVAEQLRSARETAVASQQPVALLLPSNGGAASLSQSLYVATGLSMAHVSRVIPLAREHQRAALFSGTWNLSSGSFQVFPSLTGQRNSSFDVNQWLANPNMAGYNMQKDYALVFTPDGCVTSNGVPFYQDAYYLVATAGASTAPCSAPSSGTAAVSTLSYYNASQMGRPWSIAVSPGGQVRMQEGLPGAPAGVASRESMGVTGTSSPPLASALPASNPVAQQVAILPTPSGSLPAGINTDVIAGQRLTFTINATDSSGRDLFADWTCVPANTNSTPNQGTFSFPGKERMTWDSVNQRWTSCWDWMAPMNAQPGDKFNFQATMGDGLTAMVIPQTVQQIQAIPTDQIYACVQQAYKGVTDNYLMRCNMDGTNLVYLRGGMLTNSMSVCHDGSKILSGINGGWSVLAGDTGLTLMNVTEPNCMWWEPCTISPQGDRVAYWVQDPVTFKSQLWWANLDGSNPTRVYTTTGSCYAVPQDIEWSADQTRLAFSASEVNSAPWTLHVIDAAGTNVAEPLPGKGFYGLKWSADGQSIYCTGWNLKSPNEINRYDVATRTIDPIAVTTTGGAYSYVFDISTDGLSMIYRDGGFLYKQPFPLGGATFAPVPLCTDPFTGGFIGFGVAKH